MKTKQVNFRLTLKEHEDFRAIAFAHGLDASQYFRSKFLSFNDSPNIRSKESTADMVLRAEAAVKILRLREEENSPSPFLLQRLRYLKLIEHQISEIAKTIVKGSASNLNRTQVEILESLEEIEKFIKGVF